ncbi:hypothetical protein MMC16_003435 [Acarospora aff. strigata]|nr:hypothetical protein [Acarospora aff. strigata]
MVLSPQEPPRSFIDSAPFNQPNTQLLTPNNFSQWTPSSSRTPVSTAPSHKRSRDEESAAYFDHFPDDSYFPSTGAAPSTMPKHKPIYGEGMTLLNPIHGIAISAESQTGTWFEEQAAAKLAQKSTPSSSISTASRRKPILPTRKSQRLDTTAPGLDDTALSNISQATSSPPKARPSDPTIDDSTYLLGVGWTRLRDDDADIQAAARGWAKYINNHYPVQEAHILLQSAGLNAYLVAMSDGFYLFKEDLSEGRLVGRTWETCLANLQAVPMSFEGMQMLRAARTPGSSELRRQSVCNGFGEMYTDDHAQAGSNGVPMEHVHDELGGRMDLD